MISGLYIETLPEQAMNVAKKLSEIKGIEIHHIQDGYKIIITIEADTVGSSYEIAGSLGEIEGVLIVSLAYSNFEEDPSFQQVR